jgi:hypothetical protein
VVACFLTLTACGGTLTASTRPASSPTASTTSPVTANPPSATRTGPQETATAAVPVPPGSPLAGVTFGTAIASDGTAQNRASTFHAASDSRIVAVVTLRDVPAGSTIGFIRYLDGKLVGSKIATLARRARYFYFEFTAQAKGFTRGEYRLRLYVNGHFAAEAAYRVV